MHHAHLKAKASSSRTCLLHWPFNYPYLPTHVHACAITVLSVLTDVKQMVNTILIILILAFVSF